MFYKRAKLIKSKTAKLSLYMCILWSLWIWSLAFLYYKFNLPPMEGHELEFFDQVFCQTCSWSTWQNDSFLHQMAKCSLIQGKRPIIAKSRFFYCSQFFVGENIKNKLKRGFSSIGSMTSLTCMRSSLPTGSLPCMLPTYLTIGLISIASFLSNAITFLEICDTIQ